MASGPVYVANLFKDLEGRLKVSLSKSTLEDIAEQSLYQYEMISLFKELLKEQKITNRYLAEMLGDDFKEHEL